MTKLEEKNYINLHKKFMMNWFSQGISQLRAHNLKQQNGFCQKNLQVYRDKYRASDIRNGSMALNRVDMHCQL